MSILITGATGYIGKVLSNELQTNCRTVVREKWAGKFDNEFIVDNLDGVTNWDGAFKGCRTVIHLAGLAHSEFSNADDFHSVNVEGTINLAYQAVKYGIKRFVFVSSITVNGSSSKETPFCSHDDPKPRSAYARSKYDAEVALKEISKDTGLEVVIVRPPLVYGVNAPGNFQKLINLIRKLHMLPFGLVKNRRDFISVHNLADLLIKCAEHPDAGGHTFLASDFETVSTKDFTNIIAKSFGKKVFQLPVPVSFMKLFILFLGKSEVSEQLFGNLQIDSSDVKDVLGWTPPFNMYQEMSNLSENKE